MGLNITQLHLANDGMLGFFGEMMSMNNMQNFEYNPHSYFFAVFLHWCMRLSLYCELEIQIDSSKDSICSLIARDPYYGIETCMTTSS